MNTKRLIGAFRYAAKLHAPKPRKGTSIPYISHLMAVAGIVMEHGGDEDQVVAALLHDAIEDYPREGKTRQEIHDGFGDDVLKLVEDCSDSDTEPKLEWKKRKETYLTHLPEARPQAWLISLADKVHNARAILADHRQVGEEIWERFKATKEDTLWYYRSLANTFTLLTSTDGADRESRAEVRLYLLAEELDRVVSELERRAAEPRAD